MRTTGSVLWYQTRIYVRSGRYFLPFVLYLFALGLLYSAAPVPPVDGYCFSMTVWFFAMCWIGFTFAGMEDPVSEQLMVLKLQSAGRYYALQCLFLVLAGCAGSLVALLFPLLLHALNGFTLFSYRMTLPTLAWSLALHSLVAFMAGAAGSLLHPRILPDRKMAGLILLFIALVGFVTPGIIRELPALRPALWLFPPIWLVSDWFAGLTAFPTGRALLLCALYAGYGLVFSCLKVLILRKRMY